MENNFNQNQQMNLNKMEVEKGDESNNRNTDRRLTHNVLGEEKYNIPEILERLKTSGAREIINEVAKLLKEKKVLIYKIYIFIFLIFAS
jgi:hypothetical protein